jgi:hypothetical protein
MYNDLERRKYKKLVPPYIARFRTIPLVAEKMVSTDWDIVAVKNLSAGGMVYDYNKNLELDSLLDLKIDFFKSIPVLYCIGRVVRSEKLLTNSRFRIAAKFTGINEQEREMINTTVEAILRKENQTSLTSLQPLSFLLRIF